MSGWVYILLCSDNSYYTGSTNNLEIRLAQHQNGEGAKYTNKRLPVKLVFCEEYERVDDAFYTEKQIQGWSRKKKQALIEANYEKLPELAECQNESHFSNKPTSPFDSAQGPVTNVPKLNTDEATEIKEKNAIDEIRRNSPREVRRSFRSKERRSSLSGVEGHGKNGTKHNSKETS